MRMWRAGVFIMLGLPNGTAVNQEQDQGYTVYQPAVKRSTHCVFNIKLTKRVTARKKARIAKENEVSADNVPPPFANLGDLDDLIDLVNSNKDEAVTRRTRSMARKVALTTCRSLQACAMVLSTSRTTQYPTKTV